MIIINALTEIPTIDQLKQAMDDEECIEAAVLVDENDLISFGESWFLDEVSTKACGSELLIDISYDIIGKSPWGGLIVVVKGNISELLRDNQN